MMILRVVLALAFLGITAWFQVKEEYSFTQLNFYPLYSIVIAVGLLTIGYALVLNRIRNLALFAYAQIAVDIALITVIVYVTGGVASYLQTLYSLSVIGGSILLNRRGGFFAASASSIAYGLLVDMDFYGMLPGKFKILTSTVSPGWDDVLATVSANILAFFTVAYLTGYLAEETAKAERELEEKEIDYDRLERLNKLIVENITSGIMTLDESLRITSFNREAERVTGYLLKDVYYRDINDVFPRMLDAKDSAGGGIRFEGKFLKKNGEEIFLGFTISEGQGGDISMIMIFQDLTQLKAMEEQLRRDDKLRALGELSVGIAHEIRNPLASMSGSIQLLREDLDLKGENLKLMDIVLRETDRLNMLITDFLLFARPAKEKRERVDLSKIVGETISIFGNCPEASKIKIESDVREGIYVQGDARQLGQVFWNLFLNAAHSMPGGGSLNVTARLTFKQGAENRVQVKGAVSEGSCVEIKVADTGSGIRPEHINRIFDPFFSTKDSGTGLGLSIVHRIIESHGGSIGVKSGSEKGTTFKITLPLSNQLVH